MEPPPPRLSSKPPLITPSASPPPVRYTPVPYRAPGSASPTKRQRTATPRRSVHDSASSSNSRTQTPVVDYQKERDASRTRLLDVWASLAERYCRDDQDDDVVDLNTGEIITDNGFLRKVPLVTFGSLASAVEDGAETEAEEEEDDDEYGLDELDFWAEPDSDGVEPQSDDQSKVNVQAPVPPPVTHSTPADDADLRAFLEAEETRKQLQGDESEEEDAGSSEEKLSQDDSDAHSEEEDVEDPDARTPSEDGDKEESDIEPGQSVPHGESSSDYLEPLPSFSEDELDNWDEDESNTIQVVDEDQIEEPELNVAASNEDSDSEIEIIEGPYVPIAKTTNKADQPRPDPPLSGTRRRPLQLYTPPRSSSSYAPSVSPVPRTFDSPPPGLVTVQDELPSSSIPSPKHKKTNPKTPAVKEADTARSTTPKLDLAKVRKAKTPQQRHSPPAPALSVNAKSSAPPVQTPRPSPRKLRPVVEITPLKGLKLYGTPSKKPNPAVSSVIKPIPIPEVVEIPSPEPSPSKRKGKEKATNNKPFTRSSKELSSPPTKLQGSHSTDEDSSLPERSRPTSKGMPQTSKPVLPDVTGHKAQQGSPRKRKRIISDSEEETPAVQRRTTPNPSPTKAPRRASPHVHDPQEGPSNWHQRSTPRAPRRKKPSASDYDSESDASDYSDRRRSRRSQSRSGTLPPASHYSYHHGPFVPPPPPQAHHLHQPPQAYGAVPDPRAQLIIAQAMHQLSALVGTPWPPIPAYHDGEIPHTPSKRSQSMQPPGLPFTTPTHPHPYTYAYDPSYSRATLPPDTPEQRSSPHKSSGGGRPKTLVRRSRSRGRKVTFEVEEDSDDFIAMEERSSSPVPSSSPLKGKGKGKKTKAPGKTWSSGGSRGRSASRVSDEGTDEASEEEEKPVRRRSSRGQTPGPSSDSPQSERKRGR